MGANDGEATLAGKMGEASTLEVFRSGGNEELAKASVEATSCGVDIDVGEMEVNRHDELEAACEGAVGEAVETSGTAEGELAARVCKDLPERCILANEQLATG